MLDTTTTTEQKFTQGQNKMNDATEARIKAAIRLMVADGVFVFATFGVDGKECYTHTFNKGWNYAEVAKRPDLLTIFPTLTVHHVTRIFCTEYGERLDCKPGERLDRKPDAKLTLEYLRDKHNALLGRHKDLRERHGVLNDAVAVIEKCLATQLGPNWKTIGPAYLHRTGDLRAVD